MSNTREPDGAEGTAPGDDEAPAGVAVVQEYLKTLPGVPGVYRMINARGDALYVGKAKNLKKRVTSYTRLANQANRTRRMIMETVAMEFVTTHTEAEALLLEADLIKRYRPRYNILLRDDKSFPSILLTADHPFAQVLKHRGAQSRPGDYFGPFASVWAVNETLATLQRAFLLRSCSDAVFASRTRPCLLHQIKRCSAPCVGRIDEAEYRVSVEQARAFLSGGSRRIQEHFDALMQAASDAEEFEQAAAYRDRIRALTRIQAQHDLNLQGIGEADAVSVHQAGGQTCVQVFFFRAGASYGNRAYFPSHARDDGPEAVLEAFLGQFYAKVTPPKLVLLSHTPPNRALLAEALSVRAGRTVRLMRPQRGTKRNLINHALANAADALVLPVDAHAARFAPTSRACVAEAAIPLSLKLPDGFIPSYWRNNRPGFSPANAATESARWQSVCPSPIVTIASSGANWSSSRNRHTPEKSSGCVRFAHLPSKCFSDFGTGSRSQS